MTTKYGYKVDINSICTYSHRDDEEWGSWEESYDNDFESMYKCDKFPDIVSTLDIGKGEDCFVVWAEWSSGDSFGSGYCCATEPLAVFKDYVAAEEFVTKCESSGEDYRVKFTTSDGQSHEIYRGWVGYFENLNELHIDKTFME